MILSLLELYFRVSETPSIKRMLVYNIGENFLNEGKIFKYFPNKKIYNETWYVNTNLQKKEYSSTIYTNNLGLVQKRNITSAEDVELIVGDSFAEGQGAEPWFYSLDREGYSNGRNFVNGAILGTSPVQWEMLKNNLADKYGLQYKSVSAIVLGGSTSGPVWNFSETGLTCLHTGDCRKPYDDFYGYDFAEKNDEEIKNGITKLYESEKKFRPVLWKKVKELYASFIPHRNFVAKSNVIKNREALKRLLESGQNPGFLLLVTTKWEIPDKWTSDAQWVMDFAHQNNFQFSTCVLVEKDFHTQDGHPNAQGYEKILQCVRKATRMAN